ncbi:MAG: Phosphoglycerate mutase [Parcubacteria group bacterium GW2011_GWA2_43_11]|nr:MAG: Phosphoglycerate mutase [Parcubacteria group bacterium GW2011_GWC2_42_11]KKS85821.1 MAG: Phosphoglycerate mutase [Parcubacteria group bacterium GW2011_GWA2_43_11]
MRHQYASTPLSAEGRDQARAIANKIKKLHIDYILTSPYERAKETAELVAEVIGNPPIECSDLLVELRRPKTLHGTSWFSPKSVCIMGLVYLFASRKNWHFSDEENLEEFRTRSKEALDYIVSKEGKNILVVTHAGLMSNFISSIKHDGLDSLHEYKRALWKTLRIGNCVFVSAKWSPRGTYGETLDGTWSIEGSKTCPKVVNN